MVATAKPESSFRPIALEGLAGTAPLAFPVFLRTSEDTWILYRDVNTRVDDAQLGRLKSEGVGELYVRGDCIGDYYHRVEDNLDLILRDSSVPLELRAEVIHGVAVEVAEDLLESNPSRAGVDRAQRFLVNTAGLMLRDKNASRALRRVLRGDTGLARHSLKVAFLAMSLAPKVLGADPMLITGAGLAGLLHDVGRVGGRDAEDDHQHAVRGHDLLLGLGLPAEICSAALYHHERFDGSGLPEGLQGAEIPEMARLIGLVDTFDRVYSTQQPRIGVFDTLRIMGKAWRGCFDPEMACRLVVTFSGSV